MHALINLLKQQSKIIKLQNECTEFTESKKLGSEIFKMSVKVELKTSSALTPYYSLELNLLSSTSHISSTSHLYCPLQAGGKPSTWLPPGGLVGALYRSQKNARSTKEKLNPTEI